MRARAGTCFLLACARRLRGDTSPSPLTPFSALFTQHGLLPPLLTAATLLAANCRAPALAAAFHEHLFGAPSTCLRGTAVRGRARLVAASGSNCACCLLACMPRNAPQHPYPHHLSLPTAFCGWADATITSSHACSWLGCMPPAAAVADTHRGYSRYAAQHWARQATRRCVAGGRRALLVQGFSEGGRRGRAAGGWHGGPMAAHSLPLSQR